MLKSTNGDSNEMALTKFIELYEARYNQPITVSELFKLKDVVHIFQSKDLQGRQIKLNWRSNIDSNLENEMQDLLHSPYCSLHSSQYNEDLNGYSEMHTNGLGNNVGWLPNVIVSLRNFKSAVHKLLNDHGGQMPLLSFMDCYKSCIYNENPNASSGSNVKSSSCHLIIDYEDGIPLEHLITCAQDVQIQYNEGLFKQLHWENDKSKAKQLKNIMDQTSKHLVDFSSSRNENLSELDDSNEESQRKINQFSHEVVELFKGKIIFCQRRNILLNDQKTSYFKFS